MFDFGKSGQEGALVQISFSPQHSYALKGHTFREEVLRVRQPQMRLHCKVGNL